MHLLDICCKAGGASAGFTVTGVDREPQPRYPYEFVQADLRDLDPAWIADRFDAVTAVPASGIVHAGTDTAHALIQAASEEATR